MRQPEERISKQVLEGIERNDIQRKLLSKWKEKRYSFNKYIGLTTGEVELKSRQGQFTTQQMFQTAKGNQAQEFRSKTRDI